MPLLAGVLERFGANPVLHSVPAQLALVGRVVDTYSEERCLRLAEALARAELWQAPTLVRVRASELGDDPELANDPNLRFVPPDTRELWTDLAEQFTAKFSAADHETLRRLFALQLRLTALFDRAGVPMLAGSDMGGAQWLVAGWSLHQELDLLAQAGLAPLKVLQMTTLEGARFFGREATLGTVEPGKEANLVLLTGNPVESVSNLHAVDGVVRAGRYYARGDLDALLEAAARP
jgi:hypothetical protein